MMLNTYLCILRKNLGYFFVHSKGKKWYIGNRCKVGVTSLMSFSTYGITFVCKTGFLKEASMPSNSIYEILCTQELNMFQSVDP